MASSYMVDDHDQQHANEPDPAPRGEQDDRQAMIAAIADVREISVEAAEQLIEVEAELLRVREDLASSPTFAGAYIEDREIGGVIVISDTRDPEQAVQSARAEGELPAERYRGVQAPVALETRQELQGRISHDLKELGEEFGVTGVSVRNGQSSVTIFVRELTNEVKQGLQDRYGSEAVEVREQQRPAPNSHPPSSLGCETLYYSCNPLRGGAELKWGSAF